MLVILSILSARLGLELFLLPYAADVAKFLRGLMLEIDDQFSFLLLLIGLTLLIVSRADFKPIIPSFYNLYRFEIQKKLTLKGVLISGNILGVALGIKP